MRNKIDIYSRITIALVIALLTSELLVREVFLGYTPRVRSDLADIVVNKTLALVNIDTYRNLFKRNPSNLATLPSTGTQTPFTTAKTAQQAKQELAQVPFKPTLIRGVYAKETEDAGLVEMRFEEVEWIAVSYKRKDGSTIQLRIPKGTNPPQPGLF